MMDKQALSPIIFLYLVFNVVRELVKASAMGNAFCFPNLKEFFLTLNERTHGSPQAP